MLKSFSFLIGILLSANIAFAQDNIGTNAKSPNPAPMSKLEKKAIKKKQKQQIKIQKAETKAAKQHLKMQDKATRKRMRQSRRQANRTNANKKEFFLKRWFSHKH